MAEDPAQDEPEEPVTEAPKMGPAKQKASRTDSGWEQDPQTVKEIPVTPSARTLAATFI